MRPVALDAFGSDRRPGPELDAALLAERDAIPIELIGDRAAIESRLAAARGSASTGADELISIVDAPDQIAMDEAPARAVRAKPGASLCVAMDRLAAGDASALVSAGNSGAILAASLLRLGRLDGVERPAIVTSFPWAGEPERDGEPGAHTVVLDVGANVECKPLHLVQFAVMGAAYSSRIASVPRPRVAVLANGSERGKGTALTRQAHEILARHEEFAPRAALEFVGYVEPSELFGPRCDVAVTDGWTGNVALKLAEGAMAAWPAMLRASLAADANKPGRATKGAVTAAAITPILDQIARRFDPERRGGAALLGVDGVVMICHGACGPDALHAAIATARTFADRGLTRAIGAAVDDHRELFELARNLR